MQNIKVYILFKDNVLLCKNLHFKHMHAMVMTYNAFLLWVMIKDVYQILLYC